MRKRGAAQYDRVRGAVISAGSAAVSFSASCKSRIQEWLGHSDISTTSNIYTHLDFSSKVASAEAIMGFFPE